MVLTTTTLFAWFFLPSFLHIPNGYSIDVDRDPPRYAEPVDRDNYVAVEVPGSTRLLAGARVTLRFDGEDRGPMGEGGSLIRLRVDWKF